MSDNSKAVVFDDDNPEWTEEDFARAQRGEEIPAHIRAAFGQGKRGRPVGSIKPNAKKSLTLRLDPDVIDHFRSGGPGWQSRINETLRKAIGL